MTGSRNIGRAQPYGEGLTEADADAEGEADTDADPEAEAEGSTELEAGVEGRGTGVGSGIREDGIPTTDRSSTRRKMAATVRIHGLARWSSCAGSAPRYPRSARPSGRRSRAAGRHASGRSPGVDDVRAASSASVADARRAADRTRSSVRAMDRRSSSTCRRRSRVALVAVMPSVQASMASEAMTSSARAATARSRISPTARAE